MKCVNKIPIGHYLITGISKQYVKYFTDIVCFKLILMES